MKILIKHNYFKTNDRTRKTRAKRPFNVYDVY